MEHKDLVREEFTRQANDYAAAPAIRDAEHLQKLVEIVAPPPDSRVLEVASGPGYVAMAFAAASREVVGIDLTEAPLKLAEQMRAFWKSRPGRGTSQWHLRRCAAKSSAST